MHPRDLFGLLAKQVDSLVPGCPLPTNAGGGLTNSVSLQEWTAICREATGKEVPIASELGSSSVDVPLYITDNSRVTAKHGWTPAISPQELGRDIARWLRENEKEVKEIFC
jgi:CDP-paratose 2-epimerase